MQGLAKMVLLKRSSSKRVVLHVVLVAIVIPWSRGFQSQRLVRQPYSTTSPINGDQRQTQLHSTELAKVIEALPNDNDNDNDKTAATMQEVKGNSAESIMASEVALEAEDARMAAQLQEDEERKNIMLFLCWGVALLSALDRVAMSVAIVPLSAEFDYTDTMKGSISSLFSVGYGLGIVPAGIIVATASPRVVMACGIAVWSLATIATPAAAGYSGTIIPLLLARASVGAAESVVLPTLQTLLSSWTRTEQKSRSLATVFSGFHAGTVAAYLISPLIIDYLGDWRYIFVLYGGLGLVWLVPWLSWSKDAPQCKINKFNAGVVVDVTPIKAVDATMVAGKTRPGLMGEVTKSLKTLNEAPWNEFLTSKGCWAMLLAHAANNWGLYNTLAWSPTFYSEQYGLNVKESALFSILPSVAGALGGLLAGSIADNLLQKLEDEQDDEKRIAAVTNIRKTFQGLALFVPALSLFTLSSHIPEQPWTAQLLLMGTTGLQAFNAAGYLAANQEKAGEKWAGLLYSLTSLPAVMIGTFGVYFTGQILDWTQQDWSIVFALNAVINLIGATAFVALYDSKREFE
jgi:MFS transporter, ACS family, solute carrier family 17 (sodium-dependent inorganic phosphate cotransporter), other